MDQALFQAKLIVPRRPPDTIRRPRLLSLLEDGEACQPITILRAPTGFGKTTLLIDLARDADASVRWLSLDEWDADPKVFLNYLSLALLGAAEGVTAARSRSRERREPRAALAQMLDSIGGSERPVWAVFDDFQVVEGVAEILQLVDELAVRLPANCRLFIACRTSPPLRSLPRLRVQGRTIELGPEELSFTAGEVKEYLQAQGAALDTRDAVELFEATQGWPVAVSMLRRGGESPASPYVAEYFGAEIIHGLPADLAEFLVSTSILDSLEATVCDHLLGTTGAALLLKGLEKLNVPVLKIEAGSGQYRLHPVFRDYLRSTLLERSPDQYREAHREAAGWHLTQGRPVEAMSHLASAEDWDGFSELFVRQAPAIYRQGRWHTLMAWLRQMPSAEVLDRPDLRLWEIKILVRLSQTDEALGAINDALRSPEIVTTATRAQLETLRATALRLKGEVAAAKDAATSAAELALQANLPVENVVEARRELGIALGASGDFEEAERELREVLGFFERTGNVEETAFVGGCLGTTLGSQGRLVESAHYLEKARQSWSRVGNAKELSWVLNNLAMVYWRLGQADLAEELFVEAARMARQGGYERAEAYALVSLADIAREGGSLDSAVSRYAEAEKAATSLGEHTLVSHVLTGQSHTYRLLGEDDRALVLARRALASAEERDSPYEKALALIALGRLNRHLGRLDEGVSDLYLAAQLLEQTKAAQELAQALFYLAEAALPQRQSRTLVKLTLDRLASLVAGLGYDQFLLALAREAPALVRYGASKNLAGGYYNDLLRRLAPKTLRSGGADLLGASKLPVVEVRALGTLEVRVDGREITAIEWESEKSKEMLVLLLATRRPVLKEEVIAALWPEAATQQGSSSFHSTLHRLRRALYKDSVVESAGQYFLNPSAEFVSDVERFMKVTEGRRSAGDKDLRALTASVDLYGGPFAPGVTSEWADHLRTRLETRFLAAGSRLLSRLLKDGAYADAADAARKIVENDPYNEAAYIGLMKAHLAEADRESAVRAYRQYTELLHSDLGEQPGAEIQSLYAAARRSVEGSSARS